MGEAVRVPDRQGIFIPTVIAGLLLTILLALAGVLYQAGQIVHSLNEQEKDRVEMNRDWKESLRDLNDELKEVQGLRTNIDNIDKRLQAMERVTNEFMTETIEREASIESSIRETRSELQRQQTEHRILKDYTEGRISDLPYRQPSG